MYIPTSLLFAKDQALRKGMIYRGGLPSFKFYLLSIPAFEGIPNPVPHIHHGK